MIERKARKPKVQTVLEVIRREQLTPHMVRLYIGGENFAAFNANAFTDPYIKIFFVKPELGLEPPYNVQELRETLAPEDLPVTRTYTVREVNAEEEWISVDFVVHGEAGLAAPWAATAEPGERVVFAGPGGGYAPDASADWHLLVGDESALPAIASSIEAMTPEAQGIALIEVGGEEDEQSITAPAGIEIRWVHRGDEEAGTSNVLVEAVRNLEWRAGRVQVFAHGEREAIKKLRDVFFKQHELERKQVSISGYWAYGRVEDEFQAEKRTPIGQILPPEETAEVTASTR
ncbi:siderophore-interacting protein [Gulosibacter chungangensis]|uniref:Siderophore-interacting protein n=1 Tax=Gulosibacter chungangensis TaxID=979746 RepID=A0A7J5BDF4_9MICO|nr:siderophore-interacting protein [Gulosibacter chungangensis]KAB1644210.1 siderophore-interacting protein [Gulosibacter chungangensis]